MNLSALLAVVPWYYRALLLASLVAAAGGFFYVKGLEHSADKHAEFVAAVQTAGEKQNAKTAQIIVAQKKVNREVSNEATDLRARLAVVIADRRIVRTNTHRSEIADIPESTGGIDAIAPQPESCPSGITPEEQIIIDNAPQDALTVLLLQSWIKQQTELFYQLQKDSP